MRIILKAEEFPAGAEITSGKTKRLHEVNSKPSLTRVGYKPDITAFDDPGMTRVFGTKDRDSNFVTCRIFELLQDAGFPVAYLGQVSDTEFIAPIVEMAPVELITRRKVHPEGSIRKRRPELKPNRRFEQLTFEVCVKTHGGGKFTDVRGNPVDLKLPPDDKGKPTDDPMVLDPMAEEWQLIGKSPLFAPEVLATVRRDDILRSIDDIKEYRRLTHGAFLVIEGFFRMMGWDTYDLKVECGILKEDFTMPNGVVLKGGTIVIADVIDHDSWRVMDEFGREMSKQVFRHMLLEGNVDMEEVARIYAMVVQAVGNFHITKQALVLWRGSEKDPWPNTVLEGALYNLDLASVPGIEVVRVTLSGHKQTGAVLREINEIMGKYRNGAIYAEVGLSDGLAPILATHTCWPVVVHPTTIEKCPDDVWSSINLPSNTPVGVVGRECNTMLQALRSLAPLNPVIYAWLQYGIEQLEPIT